MGHEERFPTRARQKWQEAGSGSDGLRTLRWSGQDSNFESLDGKLAEPMIKTGLSALGGADITCLVA
jgi:hypothetical protein